MTGSRTMAAPRSDFNLVCVWIAKPDLDRLAIGTSQRLEEGELGAIACLVTDEGVLLARRRPLGAAVSNTHVVTLPLPASTSSRKWVWGLTQRTSFNVPFQVCCLPLTSNSDCTAWCAKAGVASAMRLAAANLQIPCIISRILRTRRNTRGKVQYLTWILRRSTWEPLIPAVAVNERNLQHF